MCIRDRYIGDRKVNDVPPKDRDIAMVFQSYALYPHMTVYKNMAFALELRKVPKDEMCIRDSHLSGIWSRTGSIYVCRLYEIHSAGDRGSIHDRWM